PSPYDKYVESTGVPVHRGYAIEDARTVPVGPWPERECNAAFCVLAGQKDVSEVLLAGQDAERRVALPLRPGTNRDGAGVLDRVAPVDWDARRFDVLVVGRR